jgi:hypothetical protein
MKGSLKADMGGGKVRAVYFRLSSASVKALFEPLFRLC